MKKQFIIALLALGVVSTADAQDLPKNPEPGECYVRCTTPDVYVNESVEILVTPSYTKLKVIPAEYKTVTEEVLIKEASKRLEVVPAKWGTEKITYTKKEGSNSISISSAKFSSSSETVEIKPEFAQWELGSQLPDCDSADPNDCKTWCYKGYPAEYQTLSTRVLDSDASSSKSSVNSKDATYTKRVLLEPAKIVEVDVPAEFGTVTKTVLVKDAYTVEETIPAVYKTVSKEVLQSKGGLTEWRAVDCALLEYNDLNITWDLGSAVLTPQAKAEIDNKLLPVLQDGVSVEIASHTDSRGSASSNRDLSERRAQAVTNYLISKGINSSRITSNGYGESKLLNRCSDGVSCTERDHRVNRRTQFRIIQ